MMRFRQQSIRAHLASCVVSVAILWSMALVARGDDRPNIFLFLGDNWSWPHAGALGDPMAKTPVFDRIAAEGVVFENAFCPVPSCSPTRSCLLTGRVAHQLEEAASLWSAFPRKLKVFTEQLRLAGYEVGYSGKGWSPGRYLEYGWQENPIGKQYRDFAEFLEQRDATKPFFYWHGNVSTALHQWNYDPKSWGDIDPQAIALPPEFPDAEPVRTSLAAYYASVSRVDADCAQCVALMEGRQVFDHTLMAYAADNGWQMPRGLANCYDSGTRVPLAIRWGNRLAAGRRASEFVSLTDFAPTFLEAAGIEIPGEMTGKSFLDVLLGKSSSTPRDHVFVERERHANVRRGNLSYPIRGIRTADYLYLWNMRPDRWPAGDPKAFMAVGDFGDVDGSRAKEFLLANSSRSDIEPYWRMSFSKRPEEELFDLHKDPHQLINVADDQKYATVKMQLRGRVEAWMRSTADPRVDPDYDAWDTYPYFGGRVVDENGNPVSGKDRLPKK